MPTYRGKLGGILEGEKHHWEPQTPKHRKLANGDQGKKVHYKTREICTARCLGNGNGGASESSIKRYGVSRSCTYIQTESEAGHFSCQRRHCDEGDVGWFVIGYISRPPDGIPRVAEG